MKGPRYFREDFRRTRPKVMEAAANFEVKKKLKLVGEPQTSEPPVNCRFLSRASMIGIGTEALEMGFRYVNK